MPAVRFAVYIQPRASRTELAGMHGDAIKIRIMAPAVENAANRSLLEFVAEQLGVAKSLVRIVSGATNRRKKLELNDGGIGGRDCNVARLVAIVAVVICAQLRADQVEHRGRDLLSA